MEHPFEVNDILYNSHGSYCALEEIYQLEVVERNNDTFEDVSKEWIRKHRYHLAIWVCQNPLDAFRYNISIEKWNWSDKKLKKHFPAYLNDIHEVKLEEGDKIIAYDNNGGYLLVRDVN